MKNNLLSETDALGNVVSYAYSPEGWLTRKTKADGTVLTYEYDRTGSLLTQNLGEGQRIITEYSPASFLLGFSQSSGLSLWFYQGSSASDHSFYIVEGYAARLSNASLLSL